MFRQGIQYERFYEQPLELRNCHDKLCMATILATVLLPVTLIFLML
jgi:hypothetical protein